MAVAANPSNPKGLRHLTNRSQFLRAARGNRAGRPAFALQAIRADDLPADALPGIGYTVTKKTGNSPERNRIKRRLRAVVGACAGDFKPQHDYVLVGRREALGEAYGKLVADLGTLLAKVHAGKASSNTAPGPRNARP